MFFEGAGTRSINFKGRVKIGRSRITLKGRDKI